MKKSILALTMAVMAMPVLPATQAMAHDHGHGHGHYRHHDRYDSHGRYRTPHRITRRDHIWRGRNGRYYCRRDNGTTGLLIGAGVGALAGHSIAGYGDKTLGTVIGGVAGGLLGRSIDRGDLKCR